MRLAHKDLYAAEISQHGLNAFALKVPRWPGRSGHRRSGRSALRTSSSTHKLCVSTARGYALWGSSAGARMAAGHWVPRHCPFGGPAITKTFCRGHGLHWRHSEVTASEPATFKVGDRDAHCATSWRRHGLRAAEQACRSSTTRVPASGTDRYRLHGTGVLARRFSFGKRQIRKTP